MPIYEYKCSKCGKISEFLEAAGNNAADKSCPHCGNKKMEKQFSTFAPKVKEGQSKRCCGCSDSTCPHSGR